MKQNGISCLISFVSSNIMQGCLPKALCFFKVISCNIVRDESERQGSSQHFSALHTERGSVKDKGWISCCRTSVQGSVPLQVPCVVSNITYRQVFVCCHHCVLVPIFFPLKKNLVCAQIWLYFCALFSQRKIVMLCTQSMLERNTLRTVRSSDAILIGTL